MSETSLICKHPQFAHQISKNICLMELYYPNTISKQMSFTAKVSFSSIFNLNYSNMLNNTTCEISRYNTFTTYTIKNILINLNTWMANLSPFDMNHEVNTDVEALVWVQRVSSTIAPKNYVIIYYY